MTFDWKAAERAGKSIESAMADAMGILTALYDADLIPPVALSRVTIIVANYRSALPIAKEAIERVKRGDLPTMADITGEQK